MGKHNLTTLIFFKIIIKKTLKQCIKIEMRHVKELLPQKGIITYLNHFGRETCKQFNE